MYGRNRIGKTAIYMRLSRDDEKAGESMSIENQRIILRRFVAERGGEVYGEYIDDGYTGTDFDRPGVKRLLEDAKNGKIDTVAVKDLSRFGRNYIHVGQYIDYIFPAYGIRFIALSDNIDTADRDSAAMDMMPIMNVFNEWHAANTSKKIRAVLEAERRAGKYVSWNYPYGYKAGKDANRTAVIDEEAAEVVRRIFRSRAEGKSCKKIAKELSDEKVPNPATYFTKLNGEKSERKCAPYWSAATVKRILGNPTYTGETAQHKTTRVSYKNHKIVNVPESEWVVKKNAHEPIVGRDLWERVQKIENSAQRGRADKSLKVHALSGLLICADCGKKLKYRATKRGGRIYEGCYMCRTYVDLGKKYCTSHRINESQIENLILQDLKSMLNTAIDEEKITEAFVRKREKSDIRNKYSEEKRLKSCKNRLIELDRLIQSAFEERVLNGMPERLSSELCEKFLAEKLETEKEIVMIEQRLSGEARGVTAEKYIEQIKKFLLLEKLTREICLQLIDYIKISEKNNVDGSRKIDIFYSFANVHT